MAGSTTAATGTGTLLLTEATFAGSVPSTPDLAPGGGAAADTCGGGACGGGSWGGGSCGGDDSLFTVLIVVMVAALATAGAGVSCRLSDGNGDRDAVCMFPG